MGKLKLVEFRDEVTSVFGEDLEQPDVNRAINVVIDEITGSIEFDNLLERVSISAAGTGVAPLPANVVEVKSVRHATLGRLSWVDPVEFERIFDSSAGDPEFWTRMAREVHIHPLPGGTTILSALSRLSPTKLTSDDATSPLPDSWDAPIIYLTVAHMLFMRNEDNRAVVWLSRGLGTMSQKITDKERKSIESGLGLTVGSPDEGKAGGFGGPGSAI